MGPEALVLNRHESILQMDRDPIQSGIFPVRLFSHQSLNDFALSVQDRGSISFWYYIDGFDTGSRLHQSVDDSGEAADSCESTDYQEDQDQSGCQYF